jgi:uncharacterized protein (UPF0332 family)
MNRTEEVQALMRKARRALDAARLLLEGGAPEGAANRLYYAAFHAARAALMLEDETPNTHKGIKARFSYHFIRTGRLPRELTRTLGTAESLRSKADYDVGGFITVEAVEPILAQAERFVEAVADLIDA